MQKDNAKVGKISIFNSLDVKLKFLTSWVELTQFSVESSCIKLKICSIQLKLSWKCEQLNFESSWIQNVNLKLNSMISLVVVNLAVVDLAVLNNVDIESSFKFENLDYENDMKRSTSILSSFFSSDIVN